MSRMRQFSGVSDDIYDSKPFSSANSRERTAIATAAAAVSAFERLMSQHKDLSDRFSFHMLQLQKTFKEAETLRQENTNLRVANCELNHQISLLLEAAASYSEERVDNALTESPTSVIEQKGEEEEGRISLPKSISVRSKEYLRTSPVGTLACVSATSASGSEGKSKPKRGGSSKTRVLSPVSGPQKVYMRGGSNKDGPIELDVFNQGMFKTELCNKWQETGECPYGDNCQFAHGMKELRPVIRHPRYKTEVCRMVLAGDPCPYGHRCHFRHALTQEEQLMLPPRLE